MRGPAVARLGFCTRCMDDFGVPLVTKRSYLTPAWTIGVVLLKVPEPAPLDARQMRGPGACQDFTAVQQASWDEVFLTGAQGNLFSVDE